jgi:hypothetical protein
MPIDTKDPRRQLFRVVVNHLLAEGKERDNPIPVNDLGDLAHGRAVCWPNQESLLSQVQINILRDAVERYTVAIPEGSGVYEELNPLKAAETQFPGYKATWDHITGQVVLHKDRARFAINVVGPYEPDVETESETEE